SSLALFTLAAATARPAGALPAPAAAGAGGRKDALVRCYSGGGGRGGAPRVSLSPHGKAGRVVRPTLLRGGRHARAAGGRDGLARASLLRGDPASAARVLDRALELYPKDVDLHLDRARMLSQKGNLDEAIQTLERAVKLAPSEPDVLRHLAEAYQQKKDWRNAQETWLRVAQLVPDAPESHVALGRIYLALGKLSLAREHDALALRMSPTDAAAHPLDE